MGRPRNTLQNFWEKIFFPIDSYGCWMWIGTTGTDRYGVFVINRKPHRSSRLMWEIRYGEIPSGFCVCHACDNPRCCNPAHLFLGTQGDNIKDKVDKKRQAMGESSGRAILTESDVIEIFRLRHIGLTHKEISKVFDIDRSHVGDILHSKCWRHLKFDPIFGNNNHKLTKEDVVKIRSLRKDGYKQHQLAEMFHVTQANISEVVLGRTWKSSVLPGSVEPTVEEGAVLGLASDAGSGSLVLDKLDEPSTKMVV